MAADVAGAQRKTIGDDKDDPLDLPHLLTLEQLPLHHRDPFDPLLVAQSSCAIAAAIGDCQSRQSTSVHSRAGILAPARPPTPAPWSGRSHQPLPTRLARG